MKKKGFTLVEVAMTVALTAVVALSVYSTLSYGLKLWQKAQAGLAEEDAAIFFSKINDEFENVFVFQGLELKGNASELSLPAFIKGSVHFAKDVQGIGLVKYSFNGDDASLLKSISSLSDMHESGSILPDAVLDNITSFSFSYYFFDTDKQVHIWSNEWPPQDGVPENSVFPMAVRVGLNFQKNEKMYEYNQTFSLPLAQ